MQCFANEICFVSQLPRGDYVKVPQGLTPQNVAIGMRVREDNSLVSRLGSALVQMADCGCLLPRDGAGPLKKVWGCEKITPVRA